MIADPGQILDATAADEDHRVLLQVVADAGDVGGDLEARGETDACHLAQSRVGLLRGGGVDPGAHPPSLGAGAQGGRLRLAGETLPLGADQLLDCGHRGPVCCSVWTGSV